MTLIAVVVAVWPIIAELGPIQRFLIKLADGTFATSSRAEGISDILAYGFQFFGRGHLDYDRVWRDGFDYPHNIFVELWAFFGATGLLVSVFLALSLVKVWRRLLRRDASFFDLEFVAIFVGANLSGDLADNYGLVGIALAAFCRRATPTRLPEQSPISEQWK